MKVLTFGVTNWNDKSEAEIYESTLHAWYKRTKAYVNSNEIFLSTGSYSNPKYNPLDIPLIQNGLFKTKKYGRGWNYFRNGFITGLWYSLFKTDWDIVLHNQCRMFLGEDMNHYLEEFYKRDELIMAPKFSNIACTVVEVGFIAMKREAVLKIVTQGERPSLWENDFEVPNVEDEMYHLFCDSWYDPFQLRTTRKRDWNYPNPSPYHLEMDEFLNLPLISTSHHATTEEINAWCELHKLP